MAPLALELKKYPEIESSVCVTAQHREMLGPGFWRYSSSKPDYDLDIMKERQTLIGITTRILEGLDKVMKEEKPDIVLVHGDTSTSFVGALAAFYNQIRVGHVEAGLRTYDKYSPFPEEMNRCLTGRIADLHFSPTVQNRENLIREAIPAENIFLTGNTVIDALKTTVRDDYVFENDVLNKLDFENKRIIVVTAHRRENLGEPLENICNALKEIVTAHDDVELVYPVHLNPAVRETVFEILGGVDGVHLIDPINVDELHNLMARSFMVMTDSGGIQEEAPALGKTCFGTQTRNRAPRSGCGRHCQDCRSEQGCHREYGKRAVG